MATKVGTSRSRKETLLPASVSMPSWRAEAWGAIGVTALFIAITGWWLTQDRSVPIYDAGRHIILAINFHNQIGSGRLLDSLSLILPYPPFAYLVGSLGVFVGGAGIASLILAENLFFVTLLALGCYHVGRLAFSPLAGLLAVVFALGSPLIIPQFHVFMIDAPETAMVAVSVWLIIATERFSSLRVSALAGLAVGLGMLTKEPFPIFVIGVIGVTAVRGGWRSWRGMAVFATVALVVALPWYIHEFGQVKAIAIEATSSSKNYLAPQLHLPAGVAPPRLSRANLEWYSWGIINLQLFLPLFIFAAVGWVWTLVGFARHRAVSPLALELTVGSFLGWLILTLTYVHDTRYSMPLLLYLAVFGAGWIVRLPHTPRIVATTALALVAIANTLGASFGVGRQLQFSLPGSFLTAPKKPVPVVVYSSNGFLVSGPNRDGDLLGMLRALRRDGVQAIQWYPEQALTPGFSSLGVAALSQIAGLESIGIDSEAELRPRQAVLLHATITPEDVPPCVRLSDGTGVWVRLATPSAQQSKLYCPIPLPHFYDLQ